MKRIVFLLGSLLTIVLMFSCKPEADDKIPIEVLEDFSKFWKWDYKKFPSYDSSSKYFRQPSALVFTSREELMPYWNWNVRDTTIPIFDFQDHSLLAVHFGVIACRYTVKLRQEDPTVYRLDISAYKSPFDIDNELWFVGLKIPSYIPKDAEFHIHITQIRQ